VVAALRSGGAKSTGKLYGELCPNKEMSRDAFEEVLGATARAGLLQLSDEAFQKDGKQIPYRKASLTRANHPDRLVASVCVVAEKSPTATYSNSSSPDITT
jgi:hypothetical protein